MSAADATCEKVAAVAAKKIAKRLIAMLPRVVYAEDTGKAVSVAE